jgi:hypothetical protein
MPLDCPTKVRYRVKKTGKKSIRLAFCGNEVVETKTLRKKVRRGGK